MELKKYSKTPLYHQLKELFKEKIEKGEWKIDDKIPSERKLEQKYNVSRMTVRKAITDLTNEGILSRQQGKGTFVNDLRVEQNLVKLKGFTEDMRSKGFKPSTSVLETAEITPDIDVREKLELNLGENVFCLKRLRYANNKPMAYEQAFVAKKLCPTLLEYDLEQSLYKILKSEFDLELNCATQSLEAGTADKDQAELLNIEKNDPLLVLRRLTTNRENIPIEFVKSLYRGDRFKFVVKLS